MQSKKKDYLSRFKNQATYYLMCAPGMLWLFFFSIVPMAGILMAFQDFKPKKGILGSQFIGLENFEYLFSMKDAQNVILNTVIIAFAKIVLNMIIPLAFALMLNEVRRIRLKKAVPTIVYLPHFLSWVILASVMTNIFGYDGIVNLARGVFGQEKVVFLSDYAHHPNEIEQSVKSVRELYKDKRIAAIFQPHLYTRTRDFYKEFADALSLLDVVYLCDIYPAREQPIEGVTSQLIYDNLRSGIEKHLIHKEDILGVARSRNFDVLMSLGAGDIENYVPQITEILSRKA